MGFPSKFDSWCEECGVVVPIGSGDVSRTPIHSDREWICRCDECKKRHLAQAKRQRKRQMGYEVDRERLQGLSDREWIAHRALLHKKQYPAFNLERLMEWIDEHEPSWVKWAARMTIGHLNKKRRHEQSEYAQPMLYDTQDDSQESERIHEHLRCITMPSLN